MGRRSWNNMNWLNIFTRSFLNWTAASLPPSFSQFNADDIRRRRRHRIRPHWLNSSLCQTRSTARGAAETWYLLLSLPNISSWSMFMFIIQKVELKNLRSLCDPSKLLTEKIHEEISNKWGKFWTMQSLRILIIRNFIEFYIHPRTHAHVERGMWILCGFVHWELWPSSCQLSLQGSQTVIGGCYHYPSAIESIHYVINGHFSNVRG